MASENKDGAKDSAHKEDDVAGHPIRSMQLGVYRVVTEVPPPLSLPEQWKKATRAFPTLWRLLRDVYTSSPWLFFLFILAQGWYSAIEPTLSLHLSSRILTIVRSLFSFYYLRSQTSSDRSWLEKGQS
jgi:hypothetical protein